VLSVVLVEELAMTRRLSDCEPEIGALLTCGVDFATQAKLRPDWEFARTQTLMKGASYCDFRWRLRSPAQKNDNDS
jgi:hypothetical protein